MGEDLIIFNGVNLIKLKIENYEGGIYLPSPVGTQLQLDDGLKILAMREKNECHSKRHCSCVSSGSVVVHDTGSPPELAGLILA